MIIAPSRINLLFTAQW